MPKHNAANERIKREYLQYLRHARRHSEASLDAVAKAIARFEEATGWKDFGRFHRAQAMAFKRKLDDARAVRTGKPLSRATVHSTLSALRQFLIWLAGQPGYKSKLAYDDAEYFNLSEKEVRVANARRDKPFPTLDQVHHVLGLMPAETDIELRDRALIALALLTGARDGALASFKMKHVNMAERLVQQDGRDVKTKFSKTFTTWFFPVGGEALEIFTHYYAHLRGKLLWGDDDPLFPATQLGLSAEGGFTPIGLSRNGWNSAAPIRAIFRKTFEQASLPYFNPHSFRDTLVQLGEKVCTSPESFKAWSQNLGHEGVLTTLTNYGQVSSHRQAELIRGIGVACTANAIDPALVAQALLAMRNLSPNESGDVPLSSNYLRC